MFELWGITVTGGTVVLALVLVAIIARIAWGRPLAILAVGGLIGAVHAVAYWTAYLDAAALASVRETAADVSVGAFFAVAGAIDAVFAAVGRAITWVIDALAGVSMPETSVSVLEFGTFLLAIVVVSALVCGALIRIARWTTGTPIGEWLAGFGVVFGAIGILWTLLPVPVGELTAIHALLVAVALIAGVAIVAVAVRIPTPALRKRVRAGDR
jgi:hypothetical protein